MPLTILAVAAGVSWWSSHVARQEQAEVHAFVTAVCDDVRAGRNPSARLAATDGLIRNTLAARLRSLLGSSDESSQRLRVKVVAGDTPDPGMQTGGATHTVILSLDRTEALGLRVVHGGSGTNIAIIGFWVPQ
jgi:hypothetical protein